LQHAYKAGDPTIWLRIPEPLLSPFVTMMPRLQAEDTQRLVDALVIAGGRQVKDSSYKELMADLERQAKGVLPGKRTPIKARSLRQIGRYGIAVTREDRVAVSSVTTLKPGTRPGAQKGGETPDG
jgi:hypothetical protein